MKLFLKIVGGLFVVAIVIGVIGGQDGKSGSSIQSTATPASAASSAPKRMSPQEQIQAMMPADEVAVIAAVEAARRQFASAPNDMVKGASRPARATAICAALHGRSVNGWVGRVTTLDSNGDGQGVLAVEISRDVSVKTWNNSFSDIGTQTLIAPTSPLFAAASQLRVGQHVRFDGTLFQDTTDCVREASISLSGSITNPEFIFRFGSISTIQ